MKKRIISLVILSTLVIPLTQPFIGEHIGENSASAEEYISEIEEVDYTKVVDIPDDNLRRIILYRLGKSNDSQITIKDMYYLREVNSYVNLGNGDYRNLKVKDLEGLQYATNLNYIDLELIRDISEEELENYTGTLKPIKDLSRIETLKIAGSSVTSEDLKDINMTELKNLTIKNSKITNLLYLNTSNNIKSLDVSGNYIRKIDSLNNFHALENLNIAGNLISDLNFLKEATKLTTLDISRNNLESQKVDGTLDLSPISNLKSLVVLEATNNGIDDISALESLEHLYTVNLSDNRILNCSYLRNNTDDSSEIALYSQERVIILEDENYEFYLPLVNINGENFKLSGYQNPEHNEIIDLENSRYELKDKNKVIAREHWNVGDFNGIVYIINKNKIKKDIETAKKTPNQHNISIAMNSIESVLNYVKYTTGFYPPYENVYLILPPSLEVWLNEKVSELENLEPITEIVIENNELNNMSVGNVRKLIVSKYPDNDQDIEWSSSDEKVLKVDSDGNIEAVGEGDAIITVRIKGTEVQSAIQIYVYENFYNDIILNKSYLNINIGHKEKLKIFEWPEGTRDNEVEWSSSDEKVVKVDDYGNVEAIGTGFAYVRATIKGRENFHGYTHVMVSEIKFDNKKLELYKGQKDELDPIVSPATPTEPKIEWSSSDENIVKVNSKGRIEAVSAGSAKVTAKIKDTDIMSEVEVVVKNVEAEIIVLDKYYFSLNQGEKSSINATVLPLNAEVKDIIWSSSNEEVVKVDEFGNVEALSEGSATLNAKVKGKDFVVSAKINVIRNEDVEKEDTEETKEEIKEEIKEEAKEEVSATSVRLNSSNVELNKDESYKLIATINPRNSKEKEITWSSSDASVATVDSTGLVKAVGKGKATITAKVKGTQVSSNATVIVNEENEIKAESIKLNKSKVEITEGNEDDLVATVTPENSTQKEIEWSSSDSSVVTVDSNGRIKSIGSGTVTITAKIKGTDISTSAEVISIAKEIPVVNEAVFTDIGEHWAKLSIMNAVDRGLFKGMSDTVFSPDLQITRGMFVTVLGRLAEETAEPNDKFADVNKEVYYAEYIAWAEENGIVKGYDNGNFEPDNNIIREEMATIIERYIAYKDIELKESDAEVFADADSISDWAKESVTKIQKAGIIEGKGEGVFDPQANSTRAEVATLLIRLIENYIE